MPFNWIFFICCIVLFFSKVQITNFIRRVLKGVSHANILLNSHEICTVSVHVLIVLILCCLFITEREKKKIYLLFWTDLLIKNIVVKAAKDVFSFSVIGQFSLMSHSSLHAGKNPPICRLPNFCTWHTHRRRSENFQDQRRLSEMIFTFMDGYRQPKASWKGLQEFFHKLKTKGAHTECTGLFFNPKNLLILWDDPFKALSGKIRNGINQVPLTHFVTCRSWLYQMRVYVVLSLWAVFTPYSFAPWWISQWTAVKSDQ